MKQAQANDLDIAREQALEQHVIKIQGVARGFLVRRKLFYFKRIMAELRAAMSRRDESKLAYWISQADELPNNGQHFPLVQEATVLLRRLEQEVKVSLQQNALCMTHHMYCARVYVLEYTCEVARLELC
jgi:hypothetical protein